MDSDTVNKHMVAIRPDGVYILNPPCGPISKDDAITLAAWLVALAGDHEGEELEEALKRVTATLADAKKAD
jgi:hypothetical protein